MKSTHVKLGTIAVISPVPMIVFTAIWCWLWFFGIGLGLLGYESVPEWIMICSMIPLGVSPLIGAVGVIYGAIKMKEKYAFVSLVLSIVGLIENLILIYVICYLGKNF